MPRSADMLVLNLLLEHNKAGKAVGAKGAMIQAIKLKSGAMSIRIEKEPLVSAAWVAPWALQPCSLLESSQPFLTRTCVVGNPRCSAEEAGH